MNNTVEMVVTIVPVMCCACGVVFGLEAGYRKQRLNDHKDWTCPNGHPQHYTGETEADTLRKQLERTKQEAEWARERARGEERRAQHAERRLAATKGVVTKMKKRVGAGVCPCCNRHFSALQRHMETKHPEFVQDEGA